MTFPPFTHVRPVENDHHPLGPMQCISLTDMTGTPRLKWFKATERSQRIRSYAQNKPEEHVVERIESEHQYGSTQSCIAIVL